MLKRVVILALLMIWCNLNAQFNVSKPTFGFTQVCASALFNNFPVSFSVSAIASQGAGNQFVIELSDSNGSFATPTVLKTFSATASPVNTNVVFPTNVYGSGYKIRVKSTNPARIGLPNDVGFSAYYAAYNQSFTINNGQSAVKLCNGQSVTLSIDSGANSPLQYPQLNYVWYKDGTVIAGEVGPSLTASQQGQYYVEVNYGSCTTSYNAYSNLVAVSNGDLTPQIQTSDSSLSICGSVSKQIICSEQNIAYVYKWYKNGVLISGATNYTYDTTTAGTYKVVVANGSCSFTSNTITLVSPIINANMLPLASNTIIPGQQIVLTVATNATSPTYTWYRNGVILAQDVTYNTLNVTKNGTYEVVVKQNNGCVIEKTAQITIDYPSGFDLSIKNTMAYTQCQSTSASLSIDKFSALTTSGPVNILGNNYGYTYQWYKGGAAVSGAIATTFDLSGALSNGTYKIGVTIPDFGEIFSNVVDVQLKISEDITINNNSPLCSNGDTVVLQSKLTDPSYTYDWHFNGTKTASNNAGNSTVTQAGNYYLVVKSGVCSLQSNTINLQGSNFNLSFSSTSSFIIPGQQLTLTVSTDALQPTYTWYKDNVLINGQTGNTLTITKNGVYKVDVKQIQGCLIEKSSEIVISYPIGFDLGVKNTIASAQCQSTTASLSLDKFSALTTSAPINILGNNYGYTYQWYKDGAAVSGATATTLNLSGAVSNGIYKLGVAIPDFGEIFSNTVDVQLKISEDIAITNNLPLCSNGNTVVLQSKLTDSNYIYDWYFNGTKILTNNTGNCTVTQAGNYYLVVKSGNCSLQSNTINLKDAAFNVLISSGTSIVVPGQTATLAVTTDAIQPSFVWYKNGVLLGGQNTSTLQISDLGVYKVVVSQTQGCILDNSSEITIGNPSDFTMTITAGVGYKECKSTGTTLKLAKLVANSTIGTIDLTNNPYNYTFQWYKNNVIVPGEVSPTLSITGFAENAEYKLQVIMPAFTNVNSNTVNVLLGLTNQVKITQSGIFCDEGSVVTLNSNYTDTSFAYEWFESSSNNVIGTLSTGTVDESGDYYLKVSSNGCGLVSNVISINPYIFSQVSVDAPEKFGIVEGGNRTVTASGADSYQWYFNNQLVSQGNMYKITEIGTYSLVVKVGSCEKTYIFEAEYLENKHVVSNTVTPNGDGFNDYWSISMNYAYKDNVLVTILDGSGNIVFRTFNYQNNWPDGNIQSSQATPVYYFTIEEMTGGMLKNGSITIVK